MVTTAVNASLLPVLGGYLHSVDDRLGEHGFRGRLLLMQSHGGVSGPERLRDLPVLTLRSGPVGGAVAASFLARRLNRPLVISCDIGGTSCDTALVLDYEVPMTDGTEVDYHPVRIPTSDIRCIGAGGGSIANIDAGGALRIGPESAGSSPGPACYGRGGTLPTLTDANLVLGRIGGDSLASAIELSTEEARRSLAGLARSLGMAIDAVADGIVTIAVANMAESIRLQTIDRGHDPREFTLIAFGGAGPLHATLLAEACSIPEVVIPVTPGVFSSLGMIVADHSHYARSSYLVPLDGADVADLGTALRRARAARHRPAAARHRRDAFAAPTKRRDALRAPGVGATRGAPGRTLRMRRSGGDSRPLPQGPPCALRLLTRGQTRRVRGAARERRGPRPVRHLRRDRAPPNGRRRRSPDVACRRRPPGRGGRRRRPRSAPSSSPATSCTGRSS